MRKQNGAIKSLDRVIYNTYATNKLPKRLSIAGFKELETVRDLLVSNGRTTTIMSGVADVLKECDFLVELRHGVFYIKTAKEF